MYLSQYERELARETYQRRMRLGMLPPPRDPYTPPEIPEDEPEPDEPEPPPPPPEPISPIPLNVAMIRNAVTNQVGMTKEELWGDGNGHRSRRNKYVLARFVAFLLCRELLTVSLPQIGRRLGVFDHSTVLHGIRRARKLMETDEGFAATVVAVRQRLGVIEQSTGSENNGME